MKYLLLWQYYTKITNFIKSKTDGILYIKLTNIEQLKYMKSFIFLLSLIFSCSASYLRNRCAQNHQWALTFDDGPSHETIHLLEILDRMNVKASFHFTTTWLQDKEYAAIVKLASLKGHTIGIRLNPEIKMAYATKEEVLASLKTSQSILYKLTKKLAVYVRLPYREASEEQIKFLACNGFVINEHTVESFDFVKNEYTDVTILAAFKSGVADHKGFSAISVQRDIVKTSVDLVGSLIGLIRSQGYKLVNLEQCLPLMKLKCD